MPQLVACVALVPAGVAVRAPPTKPPAVGCGFWPITEQR